MLILGIKKIEKMLQLRRKEDDDPCTGKSLMIFSSIITMIVLMYEIQILTGIMVEYKGVLQLEALLGMLFIMLNVMVLLVTMIFGCCGKGCCEEEKIWMFRYMLIMIGIWLILAAVIYICYRYEKDPIREQAFLYGTAGCLANILFNIPSIIIYYCYAVQHECLRRNGMKAYEQVPYFISIPNSATSANY